MRRIIYFLGIVLPWTAAVDAQQSASYKIEQGTFNNGGNPSPEVTSATYKVTLDAIGDGLAATGLSSGSYEMDPGLPPVYSPPGEVLNLLFISKIQFGWSPEPSVGKYNTYRGNLGTFPGYGNCLHTGLTTASDTDTQTPGPGAGYFYLVTAENRLNEEGIKGRDSGGDIEPNPAPCP